MFGPLPVMYKHSPIKMYPYISKCSSSRSVVSLNPNTKHQVTRHDARQLPYYSLLIYDKICIDEQLVVPIIMCMFT